MYIDDLSDIDFWTKTYVEPLHEQFPLNVGVVAKTALFQTIQRRKEHGGKIIAVCNAFWQVDLKTRVDLQNTTRASFHSHWS